MPSIGETSCFDEHFNVNSQKVRDAKEGICESVASMDALNAATMQQASLPFFETLFKIGARNGVFLKSR